MKKITKYKRPNRLAWFVGGLILKPYFACKYNIHKDIQCKVQGPCIILANHGSNSDWMISVASLYPRRVSIVCADYYFYDSRLAKLLKVFGVIPKKQFQADKSFHRNMRDVLADDGIVMLFPEGTVTEDGTIGWMSDGLAKFVKHYNVPIYTANISGSMLTHPKYSTCVNRWRVDFRCKQLCTAEQAKSMSNEQLLQSIYDDLARDDFGALRQSRYMLKGKNKAVGIDKLLYRCPHCNTEFDINASGNTIRCNSCGFVVDIDSKFEFCSTNGYDRYFANYHQWYNWQRLQLSQEILSDDDFCMSSQVKLMARSATRMQYIEQGQGTLTLTKQGYYYEGVYKGNKVAEHRSIEMVPILSIGLGLNIELDNSNGIQAFMPTNNISVVKWKLANRIIYDDIKVRGNETIGQS